MWQRRTGRWLRFRVRLDADSLVELAGQPRDLLGQLGVLREHLEVLLAHRSLARAYLCLARFEILLALNLGGVVLLQGAVADLVPFGLAGGGEQDQWGGVGGLRGERQVEQDERVRVPLKPERGRVRRDPQTDQDRLPDNEPRGAKEAREALSSYAEAIVAERSMMDETMG
jgi:hypothetical protein